MTELRSSAPHPVADSQTAQKQGLALQALAKLTRQFADRPDFERLVEILMLTLTGQFAVTNAFSVLKHPAFPSAHPIYLGTGKFKHEPTLERLVDSCDRLESVVSGGTPYRVGDLDTETTGVLVPALLRNNVAVIVPLQHEGKLFGLIGLGEKVTRRPFTDDELDLFAILSNTVTPLIVSSFLFLEIATLSDWYREILNSVKQGVFVFGPDRLLKKVNVAGFEMLQALTPALASADDLKGRPFEEVFPDPVYPGWTRRLAEPNRTTKLLDNLVARAGETERVFNVRVSQTAAGTAGESDLIVTLDDVSAQKDNENRLYHLEKFAEQGMMASSISHELNNFLALILGGVELAQMVMKMGQTDRAQTSLEKVKVSVSRMERFTTGLMDSTRLDSTKKVVNLNAVVADVLSFVAVQKRFKRIRIDTDLNAAVPDRLFDADQIAQLLLNFLNNAADAIALADRDEGVIEVCTRVDGDVIQLVVKDNGCGIPPDVKERLFRDHFTTKEKGHGFGLVTCARIISGHQATCTVESEVGQGSTFCLSFPQLSDENDAGPDGPGESPA